MAQKNDAQAPAQKKGSGAIKKSLLILIGVLLLVGGSIGATLFLTGALHKGAADDKTAVASANANANANAATDSTPAPTKAQPALYQPLDPPFIINFEDQGVLRYLQIGLSVMARDKLMIDAVNNNMPQIRNNLILLFANQKLDHLASNDGKEKLRAQALEQVQAVLHREIGEPGIEAVYYTAFVMQ